MYPPPAQQPTAGSLSPELVFLILSHVRHPHDTLPDPAHVLPTLRAAPRVCRAWHHPATEILYQRVIFTARSSRQSKLLTRSIRADPRLGELVHVLCFPELRFRACDYYRNERSSVRLWNYAVLASLCPNVIFLRLPTNLHGALSPRALPALPLPTPHTQHLLSLHLTAHPPRSGTPHHPLSLLPIPSSLPSLVHLTLSNLTLTLDPSPPLTRLPFPSLPSLRSLTLTSCLLDTRAATQIFTALRPTLTHLELWQSGYLPDLAAAAFRVLGSTLTGLVLDEYVYDALVREPGGGAPLACLVPALTSLKIAAESLDKGALRHLPPLLEKLKITALPVCPCPACATKSTLPSGAGGEGEGDMGAALAEALGEEEGEEGGALKALREIVLAGRCCAWHRWEDVLRERCARRGIRLVRDVVPGECHDKRGAARRGVDAVVRRGVVAPVRRARMWWEEVVERVAW